MTFADFAIQLVMYALAFLAYEMVSAPLGFEDEGGFKLGNPE